MSLIFQNNYSLDRHCYCGVFFIVGIGVDLAERLRAAIELDNSRTLKDISPMPRSIEIPDELYRKLEAKTAAMGRRVRDVTVELYEHWLADDSEPPVEQVSSNGTQWLEEWFSAADEAVAKAPGNQTARDILQQDRNRLEHR
jgi:hypothetical protein